jgi:hypothetical protein
MEPSIKVNGKDSIERDMEFKFGLMEQSTLAIGEIIWLMVLELSIMLMVIFMKVSGN